MLAKDGIWERVRECSVFLLLSFVIVASTAKVSLRG